MFINTYHNTYFLILPTIFMCACVIYQNRLNNANEPIIVDDIPSATHFTVKKIDTYNLKQISDLRSSDLQNVCKYYLILLSTQTISHTLTIKFF